MHSTISLLPPLLSASHIKEKITCIRAHRERLFRVEAEIHHGKLICHNYGQGGAGWTFLFGCVNESLRQFEQMLEAQPSFKKQTLCVIGAGCYGLLTAIELVHRGYSVRIVAEQVEQLPSQKAAGFFFPRPRKVSTPPEIAIFRARGLESYNTYLQIMRHEHPFIQEGARLLPAYYGLDIDPGFAPYIAAGVMQAPQRVRITFGAPKIYEAYAYQTLFIDAERMMHQLQREVQALGISIVRQKVHNFDEVEESVIFNCAGLGAKQLAHDARIVPVQGHLITLQQQPIEQLQYMLNFKVVMINGRGMPRDELIYFAPKGEGILGVTFIRGQDSLTANQHEFDRLLERCHTFLIPNL
jgi:D-amino-acid oxidase